MMMKTCPFCAEEIQDDAKVCKHCGRELTGGSKTQTYILTGLAIILVVVVIRALAISSNAAAQRDIALREAAMRRAQPIVITLGAGQPVEIQPGWYQHWDFDVPTRSCVLDAHVEGISGGNKDFIGYVMKDDDFKNWATKHPARGLESDLVAAWSPNMTLAGPGKYHMVVSNTFSVVATKIVTMTGKLTCQQ